MNFRLILSALVVGLAACGPSEAQEKVSDLSQVLANGTVVLEDAKGTGASSGSAVTGVLANKGDSEIYIAVNLSKPLLLVNSGAGQNMIVTQVYHGDGAYLSDGEQSFISLEPGAKSDIVFVAYCADFEKENPSESEGFTVSAVPQSLESVVRNISSYAKAHPDTDLTQAAQVAIWLAQGESIKGISEKFQFTAEEERLARELLQ